MRSSLPLIALALVACTKRAHVAQSDARVSLDSAHDSAVDSALSPDVEADVEARDAPRECAPWASIAQGISSRSCAPRPRNVLVAMAGWRITTESTQRWVEALDRAALGELGFDALFAVEGPRAVDYRDKELDLGALLAAIGPALRDPRARLLVVAHSSGAHVARALFHRSFSNTNASPIAERTVYVDLDGDLSIRGDPERSWAEPARRGLRWALFVGVEDRARRLDGFSRDATDAGALALAPKSERWIFDASESGCRTDVCAHLSLVNARPYARGNESYSRFEQGPVNTTWLDRVRAHFDRSRSP
ncbi:MAG: hypothetical protein U0269_20140 [Polyangiales bacterium]